VPPNTSPDTSAHTGQAEGAPPRPSEPADLHETGWRWTRGRVIAGLVVVAIFAFWIYVILLAPTPDPVDKLDDPAFAAAAEPICAATQEAILDLPSPQSAGSPEERAVLVDDGTALLRAMVADLDTEAPEGGRDGRLVGLWLDDWEVYLSDRDDYAAELAAGEDVQFTLTAKQGDQITEPLDGFAESNDMDSCSTPLDV
jgi:hypothetical protein